MKLQYVFEYLEEPITYQVLLGEEMDAVKQPGYEFIVYR